MKAEDKGNEKGQGRRKTMSCMQPKVERRDEGHSSSWKPSSFSCLAGTEAQWKPAELISENIWTKAPQGACQPAVTSKKVHLTLEGSPFKKI